MTTLLKSGDRGPDVTRLQQLLNDRGQPLPPSGVFDEETLAAVLDFQEQNLDPEGHPLAVDGRVGPLTLWSLTHPKPPAGPLRGVDLGQLPPPGSGGSAKGRAALGVALDELRQGAGEVGGDNRGPWVTKYLAPSGLAEGNAWCAAFVSWCFLRAADDQKPAMPFPYQVGARKLLRAFRDKGWARGPGDGYAPVPGDLAFWWREQRQGSLGHVGFVYEVKDGIVYTVEGNRSPKVAGFHHVLGRMEQLLGFGHVP
jgi:hypothetical protein